MTGLDCLKQEMVRRGASKAMLESKTLPMVLDIIANAGDGQIFTDISNAEKELENLRYSIKQAANNAARAREEAETQKRLAAMEMKRIEAERAQAQDYLRDIRDELTACETKEGRDAIKRALVFINAVSVDTVYDNTAYIIGLAAILSDGKCEAMPTLKKLNRKLFGEDAG